MAGKGRSAGRPVREVPVGVSPVVTRLVTEMVDTRMDKGVTLKDISVASHYSIGALSQAMTGLCVPSRGVITAYANALEVDPQPWYDLRALAVEEKHREREKRRQAEPPAPPPEAPSQAEASSSPPASKALVLRSSLGSGFRFPGTRREAETGRDTETEPDGAAAHRMYQLVAHAVEQAPLSQPHGNPTAHLLALCTVPGDLTELLRDTYQASGMSLRDISRRTPQGGVQISTSSLHKLMSSQELPTHEVLRAILIACEVPPEQVRSWLWHRNRLEIAAERAALRATATATAPALPAVSRVSYSRGPRIELSTTMAILAIMAAVLPMLIRFAS